MAPEDYQLTSETHTSKYNTHGNMHTQRTVLRKLGTMLMTKLTHTYTY